MSFSAQTYFDTQPEPHGHSQKVSSVASFIDRQIKLKRRVALVTVSFRLHHISSSESDRSVGWHNRPIREEYSEIFR